MQQAGSEDSAIENGITVLRDAIVLAGLIGEVNCAFQSIKTDQGKLTQERIVLLARLLGSELYPELTDHPLPVLERGGAELQPVYEAFHDGQVLANMLTEDSVWQCKSEGQAKWLQRHIASLARALCAVLERGLSTLKGVQDERRQSGKRSDPDGFAHAKTEA